MSSQKSEFVVDGRCSLAPGVVAMSRLCFWGVLICSTFNNVTPFSGFLCLVEGILLQRVAEGAAG